MEPLVGFRFLMKTQTMMRRREKAAVPRMVRKSELSLPQIPFKSSSWGMIVGEGVVVVEPLWRKVVLVVGELILFDDF